VIEEDNSALAAATADLLADADDRMRRGAAARAAFEARYAPVPATQPLIDLYERMTR
jgi:enterochelin esterase-like enzyme